MKLENTHVVVTGASSGIGAALARELSRAGAKITLVARRWAMLEKLAAELPSATHIVEADLADPERACEFIAASEAALGPIDVLVNNAGMQLVGPTADVSTERGEQSIRLNLLTPLRLIQHVLPGMEARGHGSIVNIASMAALAPTAGMTHYNAAKGGLAAASEALRGEVRKSGVSVVTVYPGIIEDTDMAKSALATYGTNRALSLMPRATSAQLAVRVRRAIEHNHARVVYPSSGIWARWFPGTTRFIMDRFTPELRKALPTG